MTKLKPPSVPTDKEQEKLLTLKQTADVLNIPYRQLLCLSGTGLFPEYKIGKSRKKVFVSEVLSSIRI